MKQSKLQMMTIRFNTLRVEEDEYFIDFYTKLQEIVNSMWGLGEVMSNFKIVKIS